MIVAPRRGEAVTDSGIPNTRFSAFLEDIETNTNQLLTDVSGLQTQTTQILSNTSAYSLENVTTDRAFDADAASGAISATPTQAEVENIRDAVLELADVVGTLIADLKTAGVVP